MRTPYQNELHDLVTDEAVQVVETVRFAAQPCAAEPIRFGPEAGLSATYDSGWVSLASLAPATGIKPGTLALAAYVVEQQAANTSVVTVSGSYDAAGTRVVAAIAKNITNADKTTWITDALATIQYCPYVKLQFTSVGAAPAPSVFAYIVGEGARIGAVAS
jgi:hypothetical protein